MAMSEIHPIYLILIFIAGWIVISCLISLLGGWFWIAKRFPLHNGTGFDHADRTTKISAFSFFQSTFNFHPKTEPFKTISKPSPGHFSQIQGITYLIPLQFRLIGAAVSNTVVRAGLRRAPFGPSVRPSSHLGLMAKGSRVI